jgi:hypothetical protein
MTTIPAKDIVSVQPNVLNAGGSAVETIGLMLTTSAKVPIGAVQPFANANDVAAYFGASSDEYKAANIYFNGFTNSNVLPASVLFAQYNTTDVSAYLRGGRLGLTLAQVKALTGTITIVTQDGSLTSASVNLSSATSFSNAATIIQTAFTDPSFAVTFDTVQNAFVFTTTETGASATIEYATGTSTLYTGINLTQATGAVLSQGADAASPSAFMNGVTSVTRNWATFMTIFNPDNSGNANKLLFAEWVGGTDDEFIYACWDNDAAPTVTVPASSSLGVLLADADLSGTVLVWSPDYTKAAFVCGWAGSVDFNELNGRATLKFRQQSGLVFDVTDETTANNLLANGYNFYGAWATANAQFIGLANGTISGNFLWADSYLNQISLNSGLQNAGMNLLFNTKSIPYNRAGYSQIEMALRDPILAALNFGTIRPGTDLSQSQISAVNNAAGVKIDDTLFNTGWYLQVLPAAASVRVQRGSPPITLWYCDGQSVQKLQITSINVQ